MNLENQVCSLELAKKLKELGIKQESLFCYQRIENSTESVFPRNFNLDEFRNFSEDYREAAFTTSEIGEILFEFNYENLEKLGYLEITIEKVYRSCGDYYRLTTNLFENIIEDDNEANCRAKMLIYLTENKLIDSENLK